MKRILAFSLCLLLLAGCTDQHTSPNSAPSDSPPEDTLLSKDNQPEADLLPNESMESSENITTDIDYEWYLWSNTYVREDGTTFFMNYGDEPLQIPNALSCEFDGVVLGSTTHVDGNLVPDGLLYSMEDDDGGIIEVLYSYTDDVIHISDLRTSEPDYSGDYYLAEDNLGQPLYPWYRDGEKLKLFYNPDTEMKFWATESELEEMLTFVIGLGPGYKIGEFGTYIKMKLEDVEVFADEERGGYSYRYVYESDRGPVIGTAILYNSELDTVSILDISGNEFNPSGIYYRITT